MRESKNDKKNNYWEVTRNYLLWARGFWLGNNCWGEIIERSQDWGNNSREEIGLENNDWGEKRLEY